MRICEQTIDEVTKELIGDDDITAFTDDDIATLIMVLAKMSDLLKQEQLRRIFE